MKKLFLALIAFSIFSPLPLKSMNFGSIGSKSSITVRTKNLSGTTSILVDFLVNEEPSVGLRGFLLKPGVKIELPNFSSITSSVFYENGSVATVSTEKVGTLTANTLVFYIPSNAQWIWHQVVSVRLDPIKKDHIVTLSKENDGTVVVEQK